ncbi:helix-turn-helix transcriptional regulator [Paenibacillus profundus]|uniref:Helix-turn-helix transcriptional regulator n=1 Tax=Paenibacillus profundus TaxID=1173085 RepID=A0ABS8YI61_9BACL|nr:helix-turn-helix transcriptional regulator [Paenibacillus profundus]MCE5171598.1 helix-turn-helix transcriptional regulator [Paenibacillus profundus]
MDAKMDSVTQKLLTLAESSASSQQYRMTMLQYLREAVPFAGACCTAVDPQTLLSTGAITEEGVEAIHHSLFEHEYMREVEDFNSYHTLARASDPVATLSEATEGRLEQSARYRNILLPAGFKDEMRAALVCEGACWGYLTLYRRHEHPLFEETERAFISSLVPSMAHFMRKASLTVPAEDEKWKGSEPGILLLSEQLRPISSNATADHCLSLLQDWERIDQQTLPRPVRAVCSRALSETAAVPPERTSLAKVCIRMPDGPFVTIRASKLKGSDASIQLAVWFEPATASDILPLIAEAYELTVREKDILMLVVRGCSTAELAKTLHISTYTVQDHLKSIFAKTGVTSRRELTWHMLSRFSLHPDM